MISDRAQIEAIKRTLTDPIEVARRLGLDKGARRQHGGLFVFCPAHSERTPSCSLTVGADRTLRARCFGCDLGGDVFTLLAAVLGLDPRRDFKTLLAQGALLAGISLEPGAPLPTVPRAVPRPPPPGLPPLEDATFEALVAPLLHLGQLDGSAISADVTRYLEGRHLLTVARREGWAAFPAPACQGSWIRMLVDVFGRDVVARSGLVYVNAKGEPDFRRFAHPEARLVIPWRDPSGRIYTLQRRRLDDAKPKYASTTGRTPRWPYGIHRLAGTPDAVPVAFVEGAIDAAALEALASAHGRVIVGLGIQGVGAWTTERGPRWGELARGRVASVAFDADQAGEDAVRRVADDLAAGGARRIERLRPKGAKDWAEALTARKRVEAA